MLADLHVHTRYSADARGEPVEAARRAAALGLDAIGFTEHAEQVPADPGSGYLDFAALREGVEAARGQGVRVLWGLEVDFEPSSLPGIRDAVARFRELGGDYVIGSVHAVGGRPLWHPPTLASWPASELYPAYRDVHLALIDSGLFDVIGHLDFPRRYHPAPGADAVAHLQPVLLAARDADLILEVNTAGLRRELGEPAPSMSLVERFAALGGRRVSTGSDAHATADVGADIARVTASCEALGLAVGLPDPG